jgi:uncharacterized membrane protein YfcA
MDILTIVIAVLGGFLAGVINTLAGNGSAITLTIFTELMGLPGNIANATNRVGVLLQGIASSTGFIKNKKYANVPNANLYIVISVIGAIIGVYAAMKISNDQFRQVFRYLLLVMLLVILVNPKRWLIKNSEAAVQNLYIAVPAFLLLGFYGGFIQMGMGVIFLAITVLVMKINLIDANALKTFIVALYTVVVVAIFHFNGLIEWRLGLIVAAGQATGGYLTADIASRYPNAEIWAYRLLVAVIILAILSTFDVLHFFK